MAIEEQVIEVDEQQGQQNPQDPPTKRRLLYEAVAKEYDLGTYEDFESKLKDPNKRKAFYDAVGQEYDLGTYDEFQSQIGFSVKKKVGTLDFEKSSMASGNGLQGGESTTLPQEEGIPTISMYETKDGDAIRADDIFGLVNKKSQLKEAVIPRVSGSTGGASVSFSADPEKLKESKELGEFIKSQGYDPDELENDFNGIPEDVFKIEWLSKNDILSDYKENPQLYKRKIGTIKWQSPLLDNMREAGVSYKSIDDAIRNIVAPDNSYANVRRNVKDIYKAIEQYGGDNKDEMLKNFTIDISKAYAKGGDEVDKVMQDERAKYLNENQLIGLQFLEDTDPRKAQGFSQLLIDPSLIQGDDNVKRGWEEKAKKLEQIGLGIQQSAVQEDINQLTRKYKDGREVTPQDAENMAALELKKESLTNKSKELNVKYPGAADSEIHSSIVDIIGRNPYTNAVEYPFVKLGHEVENTAEGVWSLASEPFRSEESSKLHQLAIAGEKGFSDIFLNIPSKDQILKSYSTEITPKLKAVVDPIINNPDLSDQEKYAQLYNALKQNPGEYARVPLKGSKVNINPASLWYSVSDLGATLLPFMAFETLTGGGATAGAARKLASQFTAAAATSFNTVYADAVKEGVPNPFGYALRVTAINSAAMAGAGTAGEIKKMLGTKTAIGELVNSMSDDAINALLNKKGTSAIKDFGKVIGKSFLEGAKTGAKFETLMAGAEIANAVIDKEKINPKEMAKKATVGVLNFSLLGAGTGAYKKINEIEGGSLLKASENPTDFLNEAQRQLSEKEITPEQYNQISENIKDAATVGKRIEYIDNDGKPLSEKKKAELLVEKLREYKLQESVRGDVPEKFREKVDKEIEEVKKEQEKIYEPEQEDTRTEIEMPNEVIESKTKESEGVSGSALKDADANVNKIADEYLYHGTGEGAFRRIREEGLVPQGDKHLYFADVEQYARTYAQRKGNSFGDRILRVKKSDAYSPDENTTGGDFKIKDKINPNDIEIKHNGKWVKIQEYSDENIGIMPIPKAPTQYTEAATPAKKESAGVSGSALKDVVKVENILNIPTEEANVLSMLHESKILTPEEKRILYKQYKNGVMNEKDVSKYTNIDVADLQNGDTKWAQVILDKTKGKEIKAEDIDFEELPKAPTQYTEAATPAKKESAGVSGSALKDVEDKKADIERRREEELKQYENSLIDKTELYEDGEGRKYLVHTLKNGKIRLDSANDEGKRTSTLDTYEGSVALNKLIDRPTKLKDVEVSVSKIENKINAKYDAELASLENEKQNIQPEITTEKSETENKEEIPVDVFSEEKRTVLSHRGLQEIATEMGLQDISPRDRKSDLQLLKDAETTIDKWVESGEYAKNVESLVKEAESGRVLNDEQRVIVEQHIANVRKQAQDVKKSEGVNSPAYDAKLKELQRLTKAGEMTRSEAGAALRLPNSSSQPMASLENAMIAKMEANATEALTDKQKQEVIDRYAKYESALKEMTDKYEEAERKNAELLVQSELKSISKSVTRTKKENQKEIRQSLKDQLKKEFENYKAAAQKLGVASDGGAESFAITVKMAKIITEIVKSHVVEAGDNLKEVTKRVLEDLKGVMPNVTERDVQDVIAGKYSEKKPMQSEVMAKMRSLKEEQKLLDEYDRLQNGAEPKEEKAKIKKNQRLAELRKQVSDLDADRHLKRAIENNKKQIQEYERRIREKDFETKKKLSWIENPEFKKRNPELYKEALDTYNKKQDAKHEFDLELFKDEMSRRTKLEKASDVLSKSVGTAKAIVTGIDDSALFIQTLVSSFARPVIGAKAFKQHVLDAFSQKRFDRSLAELHNSPYWDLMQKSGLDITEPKSLSAEKKEEVFNNRFSGTVKIKGKEYKLLDAPLKPFERAFTSLGNASRAIAFKTFADKYISEGYTFEKDPELFKSLARRLNEQTGRGKENEYVKKASQLVTMGIWSPKLMSAKFNLLGLSDAASLLLSKAGTKGYYRQLHPKERVAAIKDIANFATSVMALSYLIAFSTGGTVDDDPSSTTFLDIKLSDGKSYNISGQFGSYIRNIVQVARGGKTKNGEFKPYGKNQNAFSQIGDFFRGKTPPVTSAVINTIKGQDYMGRPTDALKEGQNLLTPMSVKGIVSQLERDGVSSLFTQGIPTFAGVNVKDEKDYQDQDKNKFTIYDAHSNKKRESTDEEYKKYQDELTKRLEDKLSVLKRIGVGLNKYGEITIDRSKIVKRKKYEDFTEKEKLNLKSRIKSSESEKIKKEFKF